MDKILVIHKDWAVYYYYQFVYKSLDKTKEQSACERASTRPTEAFPAVFSKNSAGCPGARVAMLKKTASQKKIEAANYPDRTCLRNIAATVMPAIRSADNAIAPDATRHGSRFAGSFPSDCGKALEYPQDQMCRTAVYCASRNLVHDPFSLKTRFVQHFRNALSA